MIERHLQQVVKMPRMHAALSLLHATAPRRQQVEKKTVLENLDLVLLAIDEICDGG